ncbi:hypothetical protein NHQ30_004082 [Ciborinia camelliae]|nr:hypothetical protein NHQ30_004082 [Ciborinia camelliae]
MATANSRTRTLGTPTTSSEDRWNKALQKLEQKHARELRRLDHSDCLTILKQVEASATKKKDEADKNAMKYRKSDGTHLYMRDAFAGVLHWVQKFREVGSTVINYDSVHAALPWAAVQFLLEIVIQGSLVYGITTDGVETISKTISQCSYMEKLLSQRVGGDESGFEDALLGLYVAILKFESYTIHYYSMSRSRRKLLLPFILPANRFQKYLDKIFVARSRLDSCAQLISCQNGVTIVEEVDKLTKSVNGLHYKVDDIAIQQTEHTKLLQDSHTAMKSEKREIILNWLSKEVPATYHIQKQDDRLKGSCQWLLHSDKYTDWRRSSLSSILWLSGIAGSGKSFLASSVIDDLHRNPTLLGANGTASIAYFYCSLNTAEPARSNPEEILRSILEQLASTSDSTGPRIRDPVLEVYEKTKQMNRGREPKAPLSIKETTETLLRVFRETPAFLIIDALDECNPVNRCDLISIFKTIVAASDSTVKIFISSRRDGNIVCQLENFAQCVFIKASDNSEDIQNYVNIKVRNAINNGQIIPGLNDLAEGIGESREVIANRMERKQRIESHITNALIRDANGMFRWADLQLDQLCSDEVNVERDIDDFLGNLPKSLEESYDFVYNKIMSSGLASQKIAIMTFRVLLNARRVLTNDEMLAAVSIDLDLDLKKIDIIAGNGSDIVNACRNLVVFDKDTSSRGSYRFAHHSVREYLLKKAGTEFTTLSTELFLMERCLCVFLWKSWNNLSPESMLKEKAQNILELNENFAKYATEFWIIHCRLAQSITSTSKFLKAFLGIDDSYSNGFLEWKQSLSPLTHRRDPPFELMLSIRESSSPLFVACLYGLTVLVKALLLHQSTDWNALSELKGNEVMHVWSGSEAAYQYYPLEIAANRGFGEIVRLFLTEPHYARGNPGQTIGTRSLYAAVRGSNKQLAKLLLDYGVDTDGLVRGDTCLNFCCRAVKEGKSGSLRNHHADAKLFGQEAKDAMAMLLLEHSANVNLSGQDGCTPLEIAIEHEATNIAKALIERGAELPKEVDRSLRAAIKSGDVALLQALRMKLGVDFTQRYPDSSTFLHVALESMHPSQEVIQFLLDTGIDIRAVDQKQNTALHAAVSSPEFVASSTTNHNGIPHAFLSAISLLLDKGLPINAKNSYKHTALDTAQMYVNDTSDRASMCSVNGLPNHPLIELLISRANTNVQPEKSEQPRISVSSPRMSLATNSHLRLPSKSTESSDNESVIDVIDDSEIPSEIEDGEWVTETHTLLNMKTVEVRRRRT